MRAIGFQADSHAEKLTEGYAGRAVGCACELRTSLAVSPTTGAAAAA